ncbi:hypothetical protein A3A60_04140 [Candidatus Curtissbacteria bacterium RIFCSPLOWO2_01_FULL_42_26]|uniref:Uncharacterized protein n=1 Tax=Candidatus Curtissbacteria bacterium RIFCSPLOWO2_01_FULL_42_26 TaxID=1797729 RepID=A0A1F5HYQ1_9BACT|nr:MAG: hypothetical protein A3A60_04140 [Candidatus Curtissbacteria bacterium RIFCSPLOWO2_01_FULL_42_26]
MTKEGKGHINSLEQLNVRFSGYFDGRIDEIKEEIRQVKQWPQSVNLGTKIRRQDQELDWLKRLIEEMQKAQTYIKSSIDKELI